MIDSLIAAAGAVAVTAILCFTLLRAWRGWLELKRLELERRSSAAAEEETAVGLRIELAAVRERLKKLEAIASGVEL